MKKWIWMEGDYIRWASRHGATVREMAHDLGKPMAWVRDRLKEMNLKEIKYADRVSRKEEHGNTGRHH